MSTSALDRPTDPIGFHSALRDAIPRCEPPQGFCGSRGAWICGQEPICRRWASNTQQA
jgi:hypothetical protein